MRFKIIIFLLVVFLPHSLKSVTEEEKLVINLPVRITAAEKQVTLKCIGSKLKLFVNNEQRKLVKITIQKKSIKKDSELGRNFVLSFQMTGITPNIENAIAYFITEVISAPDILIVLSPINAMRVTVSANKERMISKIKGFISHDRNKINNRKIVLERNLSNMYLDLRRSFMETGQIPGAYKASFTFMNSFPLQYFKYFKNYYAFPEKNFFHALKILDDRRGETWWIHFIGEPNPNISLLPFQAMDLISKYISRFSLQNQSVFSPLTAKFAQFRKTMQHREQLNCQPFLAELLKRNIPFSTVFLAKTNRLMNSRRTHSGLQNIFKLLSQNSGGIIPDLKKPFIALKNIIEHTDLFLNLSFVYNGALEPKNILVISDKNQQYLSYTTLIKNETIESLLDEQSKNKLKISRFSLNKNLLKFQISNFRLKIKDSKNYGILKIKLNLQNNKGITIFNKERTLRAAKNEISLSIPLSIEFIGDFKLIITVYDMIENNLTALEQKITLE